MIELTLPDFAFVEGYGSNDDLYGRNVILHTCSASVMEVLEKGSTLFNEDVLAYSFKNLNGTASRIAGRDIYEELIIVLHSTPLFDIENDEQFIIENIMKPAAKWYCDYCDYMDQEIIREGIDI